MLSSKFIYLFRLINISKKMKIKKTKIEIQQASNLINDFEHENVEKRLGAIKSLRFIAQVLGSQRIKSQLLPFLKEQVIYDEAPVVYQLFCNVQVLGEIMGGGLSFAFIFPLLEDGLEYEEEKVRKKVVEKYFDIVNACDLPKCQNQIMQSLKKIYNNDYDEAKEAFCLVVAKKIGLFSAPNQQELIESYISLAQSNSITKRKYAAKYSKDLITWINLIQPKILKIIDLISKDKDQTNKLFLIDTIIELSRFKAPSALQSYFNMISYQFTWRIRYELISKLEKLAAAIGKENFKTFLTYYTKYINDIEPEIRSIANRKLQEVLPFIEVEDIINRIIPAIKNIHTDQCSYVRNSLAHSLLHFCPIIGKKNTIELILPKFLNILQVEQEQEVKQTIFRKVSIICETVGIQTLSQSVLPVLEEMIANQNWRIRLQSINIMLYLLKNSQLNFLSEKIVKSIIDYMKDKANVIRKQAVKIIAQCIDQHGQIWVEKNIMMKLLPMFKSPTFLQRESIVYAIEILIPKFTQEYLSKSIYSSLSQLVQDPVQNVRIVVSTTLGVLYNNLPKQKESIKKLLKVLKEDKDNDVKEMAIAVFSKLN